MKQEIDETKEQITPSTLFEPIAIVGMACRFPQANNLNEFWDLLKNGKDTIREMPNNRWNINDYFDTDASAADKTNQRHGAFLDNIHDFDPFFFNISPAEASEMNPSQKLMLELVWETIEHSSIPYDQLAGEKVGVYFGNIWSDFEHHRKHKNAEVTSHSAVGQSANIIANRVSYTFGFHGPSLVVDTGCSSSLVALHLACQSLWDQSIDYCMAGGINHILDPDQYVLLTKFGGLSKNGKCSTFDASADGFVRGEGAGNLLLKRLSDAERDGDKIYAVIKGTAINNNGFNVNLPATSTVGQKQVLKDAYKYSGISPSDVHYVEAHGTGTQLGDPTESRALGEFFVQGRTRSLHIGSVKTNIGHLEGAAGIAGLIKVVLAMVHKQIPKSLNFSKPNPKIPFAELKLQVQQTLDSWPVGSDETLKAGVNSFGWGGTNAHTVIEEYKPKKPLLTDSTVSHREHHWAVLALSAKSDQALKALAKSYVIHIETHLGDTQDELMVFCASSVLRKPHFNYRKLFVGYDKQQMLKKLDEFSSDEEPVSPSSFDGGAHKIVFVFPGQGSQWLGMGRGLYNAMPAFRKVIDRCDKALAKYSQGWSLLEQLHAQAENSRLNEIDIVQPAIFAIQIGLAELWQSWGIVPDSIVGHSMGEVAAAYVAGSITLDEAAQVICIRSQLMKTVSGKGGGMAVTELTLEQAWKWIEDYPGISIAVNNSHKSTVLAGDTRELDQIVERLESKGLFARRIKVDVASHSQQMLPLTGDLVKALEGIKPQQCRIDLYSTARKQRITGSEMNAAYWVDNLANTVQFAWAMDSLIESEHTIFIELSPHPVLITAINECLDANNAKGVAIGSMYKEQDDHLAMYLALGDLYISGYDIRWSEFQHKTYSHVELPSYPFQREIYTVNQRPNALQSKKNDHPILGSNIVLAGNTKAMYWDSVLCTRTLPFLKGHQVNDTPVLPGCTYFEMAMQAARDVYGWENCSIEDLQFKAPVMLEDNAQINIQLNMDMNDESRNRLEFYSRTVSGERKEKWVLNAVCELKAIVADDMMPDKSALDLSLFDNAPVLCGSDYYQGLTQLGLGYEGLFQGITTIRNNGVFALARIDANAALLEASTPYILHPALLDSCFQVLFAKHTKRNDTSTKTTFLSSVEHFHVLGKTDFSDGAWVLANLEEHYSADNNATLNLSADLWICNNNKAPVIEVRGLKGKVIDTQAVEDEENRLNDWIYHIKWIKKEQKKTRLLNAAKHLGTWLIIGSEPVIAQAIKAQMHEAGCNVFVALDSHLYLTIDDPNVFHNTLNDAASYEKLLTQVQMRSDNTLKGIIHTSSIGGAVINSTLASEDIVVNQHSGSLSILRLIKGLGSVQFARPPRLVVATNGVHGIGSTMKTSQINHAPLWGLGRVIANELPQYEIQRFDLSFNPSAIEVDNLVNAILVNDQRDAEIILISGQGSYVAANYFLEGLAHYRKQSGLPVKSINWGVIKDVGMVADGEELEKYARAEGFVPIMIADALNILDGVYDIDNPQFSIMKLQPEQTAQYYPVLGKSRYFKALLEQKPGSIANDNKALLETLQGLSGQKERVQQLEDYLIKMLCRVTKAPMSRVNTSMTFKSVGLDSLMAVQLRNILEKALQVKLSITHFWEYASIEAYTRFLHNTLQTDSTEKILPTDIKSSGHSLFVVPKPNPAASIRLFCFHDAGGSSSLFQHW